MSDKDGFTALHLAVQENQQGMLQKLLSAGAFVNTQTDALTTPLHTALHFGRIGFANAMLGHAEEPLKIMHVRNAIGKTPIDMLIDLENATTPGQATPLFLAVNHNLIHVVRAMIQATDRIDLSKTMRTLEGHFVTPKSLAKIKGHWEIFRLLEEKTNATSL